MILGGKREETNHYKNKWLENSEQSCIIPFERCLGNLVGLQKCTENGSCGCLCIAAAACILHSGFTGSEIRVCKCLYASSPSSVSEDSRAGKKEVKANISAERNKMLCVDQLTLTLGMMPCHGSLRCSVTASKRQSWQPLTVSV